MPTDDQRRVIGKVTAVAADRLTVELLRGRDNFTVVGFDDVHYVARLGSYVMIPVQSDYVVTEVIGLRERDTDTRQGADHDQELNKASSAKYLDVVPIGMLPQSRDGTFRFGVSVFPSLYANALYVLDSELDRIFDVDNAVEQVPPEGDEERSRYKAITIGTSVIFDGYSVKVRVDEFFGGHVAILGNTGSGKSCTVGTILQALFLKPDEYVARGATFLVFDVNGEYRSAFSKLPAGIRRNQVYFPGSTDKLAPLDDAESTHKFRLPHWFMSVEEWELLLQASERTQRPVLRTALGLTTLFSQGAQGRLAEIQNHILASCIQYILQSDATSPSKSDRIFSILSSFETPEINLKTLKPLIAIDFGKMPKIAELSKAVEKYVITDVQLPGYANAPFTFGVLGEALDLALLYEESHGNRQIRDYCAQLLTRFKWIKEREEFAFLQAPIDNLASHEKDSDLFVEWLLGVERNGKGLIKSAQVIVVDMNEATDEVIEVASSVLARLVFDRLRKADPRNRFPVNIILEEAHRYIAQEPSRYAIDASKVFERIAKEGRKYGVFLLVASQRPSELSRTVLSQCSNFVIHRIQNPDDLSHIRQMTPFISETVLRRLPSLPKQHALIFGNAVNIPTSFKVRDVSPRPKSDDAAIRELWFKRAGELLDIGVTKAKTANGPEE